MAIFTLAVSNTTTGTVAFKTSASVTGVTVSALGKITVSSTTAAGTYTLSGTDSDRLRDSGTWTFALQVTSPDKDLELTAHANITVPATGPLGAKVPYTLPTVIDGDDTSLPTPTCTPSSDTFFDIGTTTVTCTVSDVDDANSPVTTTFTVTAQGAAAQLTSLYTTVVGMGPGTSLADIIAQVQVDLATGDIADACGTLAAFVKEVEGLSRHHHITAALATTLIATAERIEAVLSC